MRYAEKKKITKQFLTEEGTLQRDGHIFAVVQTWNCPIWWFMYTVSSNWHQTSQMCGEQSCFIFRRSQFQMLNYETEYHELDIQSGPKKCIHFLLINIFGINLNEISISGWECNIMFSQRWHRRSWLALMSNVYTQALLAGTDVLKCIHT